MKNWIDIIKKKTGLGTIAIIAIIVFISSSFAYFTASLLNIGERETSITAAQLGSVRLVAEETTFVSNNFYPGEMAIQKFEIEPVSAGGDGTSTEFLAMQNWYWTMSPSYFSKEDDDWDENEDSSTSYYPSIYAYSYSLGRESSFFKNSVRPVINLKSGSLISGNGTASNPFTVE